MCRCRTAGYWRTPRHRLPPHAVQQRELRIPSLAFIAVLILRLLRVLQALLLDRLEDSFVVRARDVEEV